MREYSIKRGHRDIKNIVKDVFGDFKEERGKIITSFGALKKIELDIEKNKLRINTASNADIDAATANETISRWNKFLELATGYTAKERANKMKRG